MVVSIIGATWVEGKQSWLSQEWWESPSLTTTTKPLMEGREDRRFKSSEVGC